MIFDRFSPRDLAKAMRKTKNEDYLMHYGMPRRSGRYPWGSGEDPYQRTGDLISRAEKLTGVKYGSQNSKTSINLKDDDSVDEFLRAVSEKQKTKGFTFTDPETNKTYTGNTAIAKSMGMSTGSFRDQLSIAKAQREARNLATAKSMREHGATYNDISQKLDMPESSVRALLGKKHDSATKASRATADFLEKQADEKGIIDIGDGVEKELGITKEKLSKAIALAQLDGYEKYGGRVPQVTNPNSAQQTTFMCLAKPGTPHSAVYDFQNIKPINDYVSNDGGDTYDKKWVFPKSMDSKRLAIRYGDEGGVEKDGVIELRRGVPDLDLGGSHYAQVRILVDGDRYLKGMAVYSDNLPDGVDVLFNTNKPSGTPMRKVLKPVKTDKDGNVDQTNPFGSLIKEGVYDPKEPSSKNGGQSYYYDKNGKKQLSLINKRSDEGDWGEWSKQLPSQFLAKQKKELIQKQLKMSEEDKDIEYKEIMSITNPTVKKNMLMSFAQDCDKAAVNLKAAALPRQSYKVILPVPSLKDNEVFAPQYHDGETVALIRFPHGGTFEIPILKVNNKNKEASSTITKQAVDAIGINAKNAGILSGADFDGDTVLVIPCNSTFSKVKITSKKPLAGLAGFEPKMQYGADDVKTDSNGNEHYYRNGHEFKIMRNTQTEMGKVSNLITDMTIKGATPDELARAVRHSMVVIDAAKHKLDYQSSYEENGIAALKEKYQKHIKDDGNVGYGAGTILSRAKGQVSVPKRQGTPRINPETGELIYKTSDRLYYTDPKTGKQKMRTQQSSQMMETPDARTLSSGHPVEELYANYANHMKSLANAARKEYVSTGTLTYNPDAAKKYAKEVDHLKSQLLIAELNKPRERQAQFIANSVIKKMKDEDEEFASNRKEVKKQAQKELVKARASVGAKRHPIDISDKEFEAIQAGAIHDSELEKILKYADKDRVRDLALPKPSASLTRAKENKAKQMAANDYTLQEIADSLGVSTSTVSKYLNGKM